MSRFAPRALAVAAIALTFTQLIAGDTMQPRIVARGAAQSAPVTPYVFDGDVRDLPKPTEWKPGDPIMEIPQRFYRPPGQSSSRPREPGVDPLAGRQPERSRTVGEGRTIISRNFPGQPFTGIYPPDTNGDVGPSHYIQTINHSSGAIAAIYDKAEPTPNLLATFMLDSLGSGSCTAGLGDPIALYDRFADRWLLAEFPLYGDALCVYISQSGDPISGGWYSYEFLVPVFPDYPKFSAWPADANGGDGSFIVTTNEELPGLYALDRGAMLAGAAATFQRLTISSTLSGFGVQALTPADPDGPDPPAAGEPAIVMRHRDTEHHGGPPASGDLLEMWTFDVDWTTPANTTLTAEPSIDVAEFNSDLNTPHTGSFTQPGTDVPLASLHEIIMWRLQYYNHGDRETLMGNFTVDVDGTHHGGIRWFELERSGGGAWLLAQEGTYSIDDENRWMAGSSMDRLGNIAIGYSVCSGTVYPSLRYTGRFADDSAGVMSLEESAIHDGSGSSTFARWGDYAAMALDPDDDCTFWFTSMDGGVPTWRTQIFSFRFDSCDCALFPPPPVVSADAAGDNMIEVVWQDSAFGSITEYWIRRSTTPGGPYELLTVVPDSSPGLPGGPDYIYEDGDVSGAITYYYVVVADDGGSCRSAATNEVSATATGDCTLPPLFDGLLGLESADSDGCELDLQWDPAVPECSGGITYNIYRSTTPDFTPSPANMLATGLTGTTYADLNALLPDTEYHYVVRAVDGSNGREDENLVALSGAAGGPWILSSWSDDAGDTGAAALTVESPWHVDGSEGHTGPAVYKTGSYGVYRCSRLRTPQLSLGAGATLTFWSKYDIEKSQDKGEVQISTDGGQTFERVHMDYPSSAVEGTDWCGLPAGMYFTGTNLGWAAYTADLSSWEGQEVIIAFTLSANDSGAGQGWWIDDITITNVGTQTACTTTGSCPDNPFVDVQPDGAMAACYSGGAALTAATSGGTGPFSYQWYRDGYEIAGATTDTHQPAELGAHRYNVKVRSSSCTDDVTDSFDTEVTLADGPIFGGVRSVGLTQDPTCSLMVEWDPATVVCGGPAEYFVYRDTGPGVAATRDNLVASGLSGTSYVDDGGLVEHTPYHYLVRALDRSTMQFDSNVAEASAEAAGPHSGIYPVFSDDFENPATFADWTVLTGPGPHSCGEWERTASGVERPWHGAGFYAMSKSEECQPLMAETSTSLDSPAIDLAFSGISSVTLEYDDSYYHHDGDDATVEVWDGGKWDIIWADSDERSNAHHIVDVTGFAAGNDAFRVRFNYQNAANDKWFSVDEVEVIVDAYNSCATAAGPPPAPDGGAGTAPLRGDRLTPAGDAIALTWDASSCTAADYNLLYGDLAGVAGYALSGSRCSLGSGGSYTWSGVPAGDLFFLVVGVDGTGVESSWGMSSLPAERNGMNHSGECSVISKEISAGCP